MKTRSEVKITHCNLYRERVHTVFCRLTKGEISTLLSVQKLSAITGKHQHVISIKQLQENMNAFWNIISRNIIHIIKCKVDCNGDVVLGGCRRRRFGPWVDMEVGVGRAGGCLLFCTRRKLGDKFSLPGKLHNFFGDCYFYPQCPENI